ncbi:MAG: HEPN domain-containing protein [Ginsengibacter sp.]
MLSKKDHIDYWLTSAEQDWERAMFLYEKKDYVFCLFCVHLSIEKLTKALWVKENKNNNYPPRIHEIKYLLADTSFTPDPVQSLFIDNLQRYQIEGRYPDYKKLIYSYTTSGYTDELLNHAKKLKKCLQDKIS